MTSTDHDPAASCDAAVVVAGGDARRLGRDKPELVVGGRRLLDAAIDAAGGAPTVVVGPPRAVPEHVVVVREDPPGGGPLAAVAAGLAAIPAAARTVAVLAADLPEVEPSTLARLAMLRAETGAPVALAEDPHGRPQYLLAVWETAALRSALAGIGSAANTPVRAILPPDAPRLRLPLDDIDTPEDLARAERSPLAVRRLLRSVLPVLPAAGGPPVPGAVLAEPLVAAAPFPPFDQSAMDGWAVAGPAPWRPVDGAALAGHAAPPLAAGTAVRIATGARLPAGADRVVRDEEIELDGAFLTCTDRLRNDVRSTGSAWPAGATLAPAGAAIDPSLVSLARAAGVAAISARGPVRIRLHTSGDEVGAAGRAGLPETARGPVTALFEASGARVLRGHHLPDAPASFRVALLPDGADVVAVIGATGRGAADRLRGALAEAGATLLIDGVDVRPGGSLLVATVPDGPVVLGLGGNPMAAMLGAALLAWPLRAALLHETPRAAELLALADPNPDDRWRMLPVEPDGAGRWRLPATVATPHLRDAVGRRAIALVPPRARRGDLVERLA
ncbi:NTP transferase domain-containing protein [Tsukamurella ocularis]|uniref:NTP transferase domain-containing protein n=1 Tax=Tsukamurella ocularis TaxID=1970234 RepID=UPI0021672216|nr:NTP transferase domain-containing protein [Tsukamurella ocularis]MCS3780482.1 molybdopterin biosynthesis enzyme/molybdopterin-guanine dinucleotide biosynthesis protein A [Tsukamurella ocularis]MCS3785963.1 molybdopterin biosynthesis enzyme/molybdopterin-guanine dinucleotide biosynthesis protein A [Tsukamurella ocularis]MCS3849327.1 molybdopterin biosynthesis enzyme/molybdopterin-guanine dinucleotide biosynthesis protein A [Tsukamurella ocularis]